MKNFEETHHSQLVTLFCLLAATLPTGTGTDVDPSLSVSNFSTASGGTSPPRLPTHDGQFQLLQFQLYHLYACLQLGLLNQQEHHSVPNSTAELQLRDT
jgi:hypothetical protein